MKGYDETRQVKSYFRFVFIFTGLFFSLATSAHSQETGLTAEPAAPVAEKEAKDWNVLSSHESKLAAQVPNCVVVGRENIVLLWNLDMKTSYCAESGIKNREQLADWLERAYGVLRDVTFHDPNAANEQKNGERHRLAIVWNGRENYLFGGQKRPYIGGKEAPGSEAWFHYVCHELGHDFFHLHPDFKDKIRGWVEAMAEYMHFYLLQQMGMPQAEQNFEKKLVSSYRVDPFSRYRGKAYQFVLKQRKNNWESPKELLMALRGQNVDLFMTGKAEEPTGPPRDISEALVTAWDFDGGNGLEDKASNGAVKDNLTMLGNVAVRGGAALVSKDAGAALRATSSADLEQTGEMTIWTRFRVPSKSATKISILSLIDKRYFTTPESRSYALLLTHSDVFGVWGIGGQVSADGTRAQDVSFTKGIAAIESDGWNEVALVVRKVGSSLFVSCLGAAGEYGGEWDYLPANGPEKMPVGSIYRGNQPLLIGNDATMKAKAAAIEFDEVRIYNRALTGDELLTIVPGELSRPYVDRQNVEEIQ